MADARWVVNGDRYNIVLDQHFEEDPYAFKLNAARGQTDIFHRETPPGTSGGSLKGSTGFREIPWRYATT